MARRVGDKTPPKRGSMIGKTKKRPTKKVLKEIYSRCSLTEGAEELECSTPTFRKWLEEANIEIRGRGQVPPRR